MARSKYIYLVTRDNGCVIYGGFTVKYEAVHYAAFETHWPISRLNLERMPDGGGEPVNIGWDWDNYTPRNGLYRCINGCSQFKTVRAKDLKDGRVTIDGEVYELRDGQLHVVVPKEQR